ncbi:MAG: hypothetical protein AB7Q16_06485 [Vicinamibacterales bacterium]
MTWRGWTLLAVTALAVAFAAAYALIVPPRQRSAPDETSPSPATALTAPPPVPFVMLRSLFADDSHGSMGMVPLSDPGGARFISGLRCERVFFAAGRGVCLTMGLEGIVTTYAAEIFDERFEVTGRLPLTGLPSRVRVSPDGRRAGITVFETGHSYAESGFSTRTTIVDTASATELAELEQFSITRDGRPFREVDFNFWGVTFTADSNRFYATLASGDTKYLVEGDIDARTARVVTTGVECPSLSPDNRRIAYKKAFTDERGLGWHLEVLDIETMTVTPLSAEARSVDDQVEWLDDGHVMYHLSSARGADVWALDVGGREPPRMLIPMAYSPAVVRKQEVRSEK